MRDSSGFLCALLLGALVVVACAPGPANGNASGRGAPAPAGLAAAEPASGGADTAGAALAPLPQKISVSYSSVAATWLPVWLARDQGLFARNGLDVDVTYIASGTTSLQSLIAGDLQFTLNSGVEPTAAYLGGAPTRIVLAWNRVLSALFMVD